MKKSDFIDYVRNGITPEGFNPFAIFWVNDGDEKGNLIVISTNKAQVVYGFVRQLLSRGVRRIYYAMDFNAMDDIGNSFVALHLLEGGWETVLIEYDKNGIIREIRTGQAHKRMTMQHVTETVLTRTPQFQ